MNRQVSSLAVKQKKDRLEKEGIIEHSFRGNMSTFDRSYRRKTSLRSQVTVVSTQKALQLGLKQE